MGLSASQGRMLLLTARKSDLEYRAQQISQKRLILSQQLEQIALEYEAATSNRQMKIALYGQDKDSTVRTTNLTYAALISGAIAAGADKSGIMANDITANLASQWQSTSAYRLVTADDAIVVSNENEIPTSVTEVKNSGSDYADTEMNEKNYVYTPKIDGVDQGNYVVYDEKKYGKDTALAKIMNGENPPGIGDISVFDGGIIKIKGEKETDTKYFKMDGSEATADETKSLKNEVSNVQILTDYANVPKNETTNKETITYNYEKEGPGSDGIITLVGSGPLAGRQYVVDVNLQRGASDINGDSTGPNYLQDCLRNGKYLLQKGQVDDNVNSGYRWSNLSWDATANISDGYYTEDDDAAKAKYDRLQNQIQAQDKKLELELDQIETQRSAVTTEEESVQKVIDENIEGSFNAFA